MLHQVQILNFKIHDFTRKSQNYYLYLRNEQIFHWLVLIRREDCIRTTGQSGQPSRRRNKRDLRSLNRYQKILFERNIERRKGLKMFSMFSKGMILALYTESNFISYSNSKKKF